MNSGKSLSNLTEVKPQLYYIHSVSNSNLCESFARRSSDAVTAIVQLVCYVVNAGNKLKGTVD